MYRIINTTRLHSDSQVQSFSLWIDIMQQGLLQTRTGWKMLGQLCYLHIFTIHKANYLTVCPEGVTRASHVGCVAIKGPELPRSTFVDQILYMMSLSHFMYSFRSLLWLNLEKKIMDLFSIHLQFRQCWSHGMAYGLEFHTGRKLWSPG